jgi:predicted  nucleic acid-binding Zn-ribbon protein
MRVVTMFSNGKQRKIRAGQAYMQAIARDPKARRAVVDLRKLAHRIQTKGAALGKVLTALRQVFVVLDQHVDAEFEELRAEWDRTFAELAERTLTC